LLDVSPVSHITEVCRNIFKLPFQWTTSLWDFGHTSADYNELCKHKGLQAIQQQQQQQQKLRGLRSTGFHNKVQKTTILLRRHNASTCRYNNLTYRLSSTFSTVTSKTPANTFMTKFPLLQVGFYSHGQVPRNGNKVHQAHEPGTTSSRQQERCNTKFVST
jgi:hypothetical protein